MISLLLSRVEKVHIMKFQDQVSQFKNYSLDTMKNWIADDKKSVQVIIFLAAMKIYLNFHDEDFRKLKTSFCY